MNNEHPPAGWWQASDGNWYPPAQPPFGGVHSPPFAAPDSSPVKPSRSSASVALIAVAAVLGVVAVLGIGSAVVVFVARGVSDVPEQDPQANPRSRDCAIESRTLRVAIEYYRSTEGGGSFAPVTLEELVRVDVLNPSVISDVLPNWTYTLGPAGQTYTLEPQGACAGFDTAD